MTELIPWLQRSFEFGLPAESFPTVLKRLESTPERAAALVLSRSNDVLSQRQGRRWSVKEHIGHLDDLSELDQKRLDQFLAGEPVLVSADMGNRKTENAGHNERPVDEIISAFRRNRDALIERLTQLQREDIVRTAHHPRLQQPMQLIDWAFFVAEHDDHHLAHARRLLITDPHGG